MHTRRLLAALTAITLLASLLMSGPVSAAKPAVQSISDADLGAKFTTVGGAQVLPTDRTVTHWFGSTLDAHDGVTYGYNMVGANPSTCSGSACGVTFETDITPLIVNIAGLTFDGNSVLNATLASPVFALNDYASTPFATNDAATLTRGAGGALSAGQAGLALQLQDATQRIQFDKGGSSPYHVRLHPNTLPSYTINVPNGQGFLLQSGRGVVFAAVNASWWASQIKNLTNQADPTHLPIYLSHDVLLFDPVGCCIIGFHGAATKNTKSNGNPKVQTFVWATYLSAGIYARPNGGVAWNIQDIHPLSHEVAEWADDPFVNNTVEPWLTPTAPQYGCTDILETGDPVVGIGIAKGNNTFFQGPNPNGSQSADGYYHPEDEVFLPWFMRSAPNLISEATQAASANIGRYTLMGDLNPAPGFRAPATGC